MSLTVKTCIQYARDVVDKKIDECQYIVQACTRFFDDLNNGESRGLVFNQEKAQDVLDFYDYVPHIKGEWAGQPIALSHWQGFVLINLFGWRWIATGLRRFKTAYIEVARKNGKSTFIAPVGLYMLFCDGEGGAEIYSAACSRDQARIIFDTARDMVRRSEIKNYITALNHSIADEKSASCFKPLAADSDTLEGKNTHCALIDELHAHKNRKVYDVLELSCAARSQPLLIVITTAGSDRHGICYEVRNYLVKVLGGVINDDSFFGVIYTIDNPDDWLDEKQWKLANPNLGISVKLDDMRRLAEKAKQTPSAANQFKTKRLNIWCDAETAYFNKQKWIGLPETRPADCEYLPCFIGLDLSSKQDITAAVAVFVDDDRRIQIKSRFYLPESVIDRRKTGKAHHIVTLYEAWAESGHLQLTPGDIIDYRLVRLDLLAMAQQYPLQEIAFDPYGAAQLAIQLQDDDGLPMVEVNQTVKNMSESMKELSALINAGFVSHDHNPAMDWMISNVTAKVDLHDNVFPRKDHDDNKIDGPVALIIAVNRILRHRELTSVYDENELLVL